MSTPVRMSPAQNVAAGLRGASGTPATASQATNIEQSRAIAEVQAMVVVAQKMPRNIHAAREAIRVSCSELAFAESAFFKFPRGGKVVTGPSIDFAVEIARCWGNINYGISELDRDDDAKRSEMLAFAWDVQTNARSMTSFIVPHKRDKGDGGGELTSNRDIYENNANMGARRLREMILRCIPSWLEEEAKALCYATLERGDGTPLAERIAAMVDAFEKIGISRGRLEDKIGAKVAQFTPGDVAQLRVSYQSIRRGEVTANAEFPQIAANAIADALKTESTDASAGDASDDAKPASQPGPQSSEAGADQPADPMEIWSRDKVDAASRAILGELMKLKTIKAIDNLLTTREHDLFQVRRADPREADRIIGQADSKKAALAVSAG